jgi:hypothetical protein
MASKRILVLVPFGPAATQKGVTGGLPPLLLSWPDPQCRIENAQCDERAQEKRRAEIPRNRKYPRDNRRDDHDPCADEAVDLSGSISGDNHTHQQLKTAGSWCLSGCRQKPKPDQLRLGHYPRLPTRRVRNEAAYFRSRVVNG